MSSENRPERHFLEASRDDLITWRDHPVTKAFIAFIEFDQRQFADASCEESFKGNQVKAAAHAGGARVLADLISLIRREIPIETPPVDSTYTDPAARRTYNV